MAKLIHETEESFYYEFPLEFYYILRRWDSREFKEYAHLYPKANGELPEGFLFRKDAQDYVDKWFGGKDFMIIGGFDAKYYEVPKRW